MTLLEEFIFSLNRIERKKLRPLQFRGAKREIFMKILNCREPEGIDQKKILARLKISKKRFYQIVAEMLHASYADVAHSGGAELLQYLGNMQLYRHFYRAMKQQEALLKHDRNALEDFYSNVLIMSEFFLIPPHLAGHIRAEFKKYLHRYATIKTKQPGDELLLRYAKIEEEISKNFSRNFSIRKLRTETDELEQLFTLAKKYDHALVQFKIAYLLATTYFRKFLTDKRPEPYLEFMNLLVEGHPDVFGRTADLIRLGIQSYIPPKPEEIEQNKTFLLHPTGESSSLLFIERFLPLVVQCGDTGLAKKIIAERFPINPDQIRKETALHWWRLLAIYYISTEEYKKAQTCVRKALEANTGKTRMTEVEMNLRCFNLFLFIMQEGPDLAADIAQRHIRYARRHGYNKGEGFMMLFLKAVHDLVSYPHFDKDHAKKVRERYIEDLDGEKRLFLLFEKIYDAYFR